MAETYKNGDSLWDMVRKILTNLSQFISGGGSYSSSGTLQNSSGTIVSANVSQVAVGALLGRKYLAIQNVSSGDLWFNFTNLATTSTPSFKLTANGSFVMDGTFVSSEAINIIGGTGGQGFTIKQG